MSEINVNTDLMMVIYFRTFTLEKQSPMSTMREKTTQNSLHYMAIPFFISDERKTLGVIPGILRTYSLTIQQSSGD